jgi:hypothetical protein
MEMTDRDGYVLPKQESIPVVAEADAAELSQNI